MPMLEVSGECLRGQGASSVPHAVDVAHLARDTIAEIDAGGPRRGG
jgi:hypothetical protein